MLFTVRMRDALFALSVMSLAGCAALKSDAGPRGDDSIARVFIDVRRAESGARFSSSLRDELVEGLSRLGVRCRVNEHEMHATEDAGKAIQEYYPDVVIAIAQTDSNGEAARAEFAVEVYRPNSAAPLWSADLSPLSGGWRPESARAIADDLLSKLKEEKIIKAPDDSR